MFHCVFRLQSYEVITRLLDKLLLKSMYQMFSFRFLGIQRIPHYFPEKLLLALTTYFYRLSHSSLCLEKSSQQSYSFILPLWTLSSHIILVESTVFVLSCIPDNKPVFFYSKCSGCIHILAKPTAAPKLYQRIIFSDILITDINYRTFIFRYIFLNTVVLMGIVFCFLFLVLL